jgi:hypothetical protein
MDFSDAIAGGTKGLSDPEVLALGAATRRIVVSSDVRTMPRHFWQFAESHDSPGLMIIPQAVETARAIDEIVSLWRDFNYEALQNQIRWVREKS